ncbi:MAG: MATE family efflux transporter [Bacteroidota bacterium]
MASDAHPFRSRPHRTLIGLTLPVLGSLVAEPITGLVDTAFVARLGAAPLAALGVGAIVLSGMFWIFSFLGVGTQTEVAQALGKGDRDRAARMASLALAMGLGFGLVVGVLGWWAAPAVSVAMGAEGEVARLAALYVRIRLLAAPAVLATVAAFGALRGVEDMQTPFRIAVAVNVANALLDGPLIFGWFGLPALGVAGAAWASTLAQILGGLWAGAAALRALGRPDVLRLGEARVLLGIGGAMVVRTGLLTLFLLLATRAATQLSTEAGAAHQAIRQVWAFSAFWLDAFAVAGQSLVARFMGEADREEARRVARIVVAWSLGSGAVIATILWSATGLVVTAFVPESAQDVFALAWIVSLASLPVNAATFATDGIHWGTGDFRFLALGMTAATTVGALGLFWVESAGGTLTGVWVVTALWVLVRAAFGLGRIWPGVGRAPLGSRVNAS